MVAGAGGGTPGTSIETLYVDIAARADQLVAEAKEAVDRVIGELDRIEEKTQEMNAGGGIGGILKGALSAGLGFGLAQVGIAGIGSVVNKVKELGSQLISTNAQMQMFTQSFTVLTGSAEEAGQIIEWVKEQAKATPFDVPGLIQASQMLMTWGLDLKEWFTVVGDVAAGMQRPISQVVNAVGTLATGQTGEAVRRFRDLGINLRESEALTFDARGALITPLEEAIPIVKQIMEERFGGMMAAQSKTWSGVMSNIGDTWQQLIQTTGEPLFEGLNAILVDLEAWISENQDALMDFARGFGQVLGDALTTLVQVVEQLASIIQFLAQIPGLLEGSPIIGDLIRMYNERGGLGGAMETARKGAAIVATPIVGGIRTVSGIVSGKDEVKNLNDLTEVLKGNYRDVLMEVSGVNQELEDQASIIEGELTPAIEAGIEAVRSLGEEYRNMSDGAIVVEAAAGNAAEGIAQVLESADFALPGLAALGQELRENADSAIVAADAYNEAAERIKYLEEEAARNAEAQAAARAEMEEAAEIAEKAAKKLQDRVEKMLEELETAGEKAAEQLKEDLANIEAEAGQAQLDAINKANEQIAEARRKFARDQVRRQEQFNRQWARLIREQNDANVDAEADYQYARENLIIEGDEKALADLDARHKMEGDRRQRDQGQARSDLQDNFQAQQQAAQENHNEQIRMLEARLQEELARIRAEAEAEKAAKIKAEEEAAAAREERAEEMHELLGEMLYNATNGNATAAELVLGYWSSTYQGIATEAVNSSFTAEQAVNRLIEQAIAAQAQLQQLANTPLPTYTTPGGRIIQRQLGGYSPGTTQPIMTHPGEFMNTAATTQALERALGRPLTQESIQRMAADLRKRIDVTVTGRGLGGAAAVDDLRRELVAALSQEVTEF